MSSERLPHAATPNPGDTLAIQKMDALVGNTPLMRLERTAGSQRAPVYIKLENMNPAGSMRDRYVAEIVERALLAGQLVEGDTIVLAGLDDSAVAAAFLSAVSGLSCRIFAPESSSKRLVPLIRRYGADIEWTNDEGGLSVAIDSAAAWARDAADRMYVDGHRRQAVRDSYRDIATEILDALGTMPLGGFVTSVTTGATFREVSKLLLDRQPMMSLAGVRLVENEFATDDVIEGVSNVTLDEAWDMRNQIARNEGLLLSPKGAACVKLALELREQVPPHQAIVAINPDAGQRYLGWEDRALFKARFDINRHG